MKVVELLGCTALEEAVFECLLMGNRKPRTEEFDTDRGEGHNTQPTDLDQRQNNKLSEYREGGTGIHDDQAGDTNRRGGRKKGIQKRNGHTRHRGNRQVQQRRACSDGAQEDEQ